MNPFLYTPADETVEGFAWANAKAKAAHDAAQASKQEADRAPAYSLTDEQYAAAALDRVGASYYDQMLAERVNSPENAAFALAIAAHLGNPKVFKKFGELQIEVAAAVAAEA